MPVKPAVSETTGKPGTVKFELMTTFMVSPFALAMVVDGVKTTVHVEVACATVEAGVKDADLIEPAEADERKSNPADCAVTRRTESAKIRSPRPDPRRKRLIMATRSPTSTNEPKLRQADLEG